jgi:uncharacterized small protein (TIGR04563 family)
MLKEIGNAATRQDRSLSWIVQKAWKAARKDVMSMPSVSDQPSGDALRPTLERRPRNLILMDIQIPGMDGLQATAELKRDQATRAIPVIALTALAMKGDEERIRAAGCDGYIAKPMRYQDFLKTVAEQLVAAP